MVMYTSRKWSKSRKVNHIRSAASSAPGSSTPLRSASIKRVWGWIAPSRWMWSSALGGTRTLTPGPLTGVGKVDEIDRKRRDLWQDGRTTTHPQEMPDALSRRMLSDARDG